MRNKKLLMYDFEQRILSIFRDAAVYYWDHKKIMEQYKLLVNIELNSKTPKAKPRYTNYMKGFVFGYYLACSNKYYAEMEFCYLIDGRLYTIAKKSKRPSIEIFYGKNQANKISNAPHGTYYKDKDIKFS